MMKKGIVVVSFGTSYPDTCAATIGAIEEEIRCAYPGIPVYRAWTSKMILAKLLKNSGTKINNVKEALAAMHKDGITDVYVQPTHIINGIENDIMKEEILEFRQDFHSIAFGSPVISSTEDMAEIVRIITDSFPSMTSEDALVLMGHGSSHSSNAVYAALDYMFKEKGYANIHIGTVEGYPELSHVQKLLKKSPAHHIHLAPLMIVAGDHANNDMAGDEDSWKRLLKDEGYSVTCHLKGLGEYPDIRRLILSHLSEVLPTKATLAH